MKGENTNPEELLERIERLEEHAGLTTTARDGSRISFAQFLEFGLTRRQAIAALGFVAAGATTAGAIGRSLETAQADDDDSGDGTVAASSLDYDSIRTRGTRIGATDDVAELLENATENERFIADTTEVFETEEIEITTDGIEIIGLNLRLAEQGQNLLSIQADNVTVERCLFDGNSTPSEDEADGQDALVYIGGETEVEDITLEKCRLIDAADTGFGVGTDTVDFDDLEWAYNVTFRDLSAHRCGDDGIACHRVENGLIENCYSWGHTNTPGGSSGFEIEWATNTLTVRNCYAMDVAGGSSRGFWVKGGGGEPPYNILFESCYSRNNQRCYQFNAESDDGTPEGIQLRGCHADAPAEGSRAVYLQDYDVEITGGRYVANGLRAIDVVDSDHSDPTLRMNGGVIDGRFIEFRAGNDHVVSGVRSVHNRSRDIRFSGNSSGRVVGFEGDLDSDQGIVASDTAGPVDVRDCEVSELNEGDDATIVLKDSSLVVDVTDFTPAEGARAFHEPGGEPAFGDGDDWRSVVTGDVL